MRSHEHFVELCALSTSGELDPQEQERLEEHLSRCRDCRAALRQFQVVVDVGIPMLFPERRMGGQNGHRHTKVDWSLGRASLAVVVLLAVAITVYAFQIAKTKDAARRAQDAADTRAMVLEQKLSDAAYEQEDLNNQLVKRDRTISNLRRQITGQSSALASLRDSQEKLKETVQNDEADNRDAASQNVKLAQELHAAQASLDKTETRLQAAQQDQKESQRRVIDLNAQVGMLTGQLHHESATVDRQAELLAHDRDIRELMGARDLYIAEVYDVAQTGATRKPFGRVFYTKDKSLVFYAYDLEQQGGVEDTAAFQAWGRNEDGRTLDLGIFYQDNTAKKRWVLKCDDGKELSEINAVFVTVEPKGGSTSPTGKRLLFAYLKIDPNHP